MAPLCLVCGETPAKQCTSCKTTFYCSKVCQKKDWKSHKIVCTELRKSQFPKGRVIYIKSGDVCSKDLFYKKSEMIELQSFGSEYMEKAEIKRKFHWKSVDGGMYKFYSSKSEDYKWYYFIYYDEESKKEKNCFASRCTGSEIKGDVVILISGPMGVDSPQYFSKDDLYDAYVFYGSHDPYQVFQEREKRRALESVPQSFFDGAGLTGNEQLFFRSVPMDIFGV